MLAISIAQQRLGQINLGADGGRWQLVSSAEPCSMCLGGIHWSGVKSVLLSARDEDVRAIGFDEGNKPRDWETALQSMGVNVTRDMLRAESCAVLQAYAQRGGIIYNAGKLGAR